MPDCVLRQRGVQPAPTHATLEAILQEQRKTNELLSQILRPIISCARSLEFLQETSLRCWHNLERISQQIREGTRLLLPIASLCNLLYTQLKQRWLRQTYVTIMKQGNSVMVLAALASCIYHQAWSLACSQARRDAWYHEILSRLTAGLLALNIKAAPAVPWRYTVCILRSSGMLLDTCTV